VKRVDQLRYLSLQDIDLLIQRSLFALLLVDFVVGVIDELANSACLMWILL
jgi:hypothetical protein